MTQRNPVAVVLLSLVTFGIYLVYWTVKTKNEMNRRGAGVPTAWLLLVPLVNIWWYWRYCQGVEFVTSGRLSAPLAFVVLWLLPAIGPAIVQDSFNRGPGVAGQPIAG